MTGLNWSYMIPIALSLVAAIVALIDAGRAPRHRRPYRLIEATILWYFFVYYIVAYLNQGSTADWYVLVRTGIFNRIGMMFLLAAFIVDIFSFTLKGGYHAHGTD